MATDFGNRLRAAQKHAKKTQQQVAKEVGMGQGTLSELMKIGTGSAFTTQIAKACGVDAHWLATGEGEMLLTKEPSNVAQAPALRTARQIPVVGEVKGGDDGYLHELQYPVGHGDGFVEYWCRDGNAYALRVRGDSMHPRYRAGEFVVVTPSIEAQQGSDVVVALKDGRKLLKQLNWKRGDEIQLLSINNHFAPMTISLDAVLAVHRVAGAVGSDALVKA